MEKVCLETFIILIFFKTEYIMCRRDSDLISFYSLGYEYLLSILCYEYCCKETGIKMNLDWNYAGLVCLQHFIRRNMFVQTKL